MKNDYPSYLKLCDSGRLRELVEILEDKVKSCGLCPWKCKVDRKRKRDVVCRAGYFPEVSSYNLHFGEEPPISGTNGSGTIFFTGCQLRCVYCQNYPISQLRNGVEVSFEELAKMMLWLQEKGAHNINFVTPTPWIFQIVKSLEIAVKKGLKIPIVYNTSGYEDRDVLKLIEGVVDIYMPDIKYAEETYAKKFSKAHRYFEIAKSAVKEMHRQVGVLKIKNGIAVKGLLIRHLVLPNNVSSTEKVLKFISEEISKETYVSLMSQYFPAYRAKEYEEISRMITPEEYERAIFYFKKYGLKNGWLQGVPLGDDFSGI